MSNEIMTTNPAILSNNGDFICTLTTDDVRSKLIIAKAVNAATPLADLGDTPFTIVDVLTMPGKRSRTGEPCKNVYLILPDGSALFSQSEGVERSVQVLVGLFNGDFGDGIKVRVIESPTKSGNNMKNLEPVFD